MSDQPGLRLVPLVKNKPGKVLLDGVEMPTITAALAAADSGAVVTVGRGRYSAPAETFPLQVPAGVTLRGPEPRKISDEARKFLPIPPPAQIVAPKSALRLAGDAATVAHLTIRTQRPVESAAIVVDDTSGCSIDTCEVSGSLTITQSRDVHVSWTTIQHGQLHVRSSRNVEVTGGSVTGTHSEHALIDIADSTAVRVEAMALTEAKMGLTARGTHDLLIGGCAILADDDAVAAGDCAQVTVNGNRLRGFHAVRLTDCTGGEIAANGIEEADVAIRLDKCQDITIGRNHVARARVEVLATPSVEEDG